MLLMRANTLCGEVVRGLALEISSFVGPCENRSYKKPQVAKKRSKASVYLSRLAQKANSGYRYNLPRSPHILSNGICNLTEMRGVHLGAGGGCEVDGSLALGII
jgi:hypothetical protein